MSDKMKKDVYVCDECDTDLACVVEHLKGGIVPTGCMFTKCRVPPNWQKTTEYEIVRKHEPTKTTDIASTIEEHYKKAHVAAPRPPDPPPKREVCEDVKFPFVIDSFIDKTEKIKRDMDEKFVDIEKELLKFATGQTPNCSICEWKEERFIGMQVHDDHSRIDHVDYLEHSMCAAQGMKDCKECYNSPECKRLFKVDDRPTLKSEAEI